MGSVPTDRITPYQGPDARPDGDWVLYWMHATRRPRANYALQHALETARALDRPLLVLEPLSTAYPWASERFHRVVCDGMTANQRAFEGTGIGYYPYVEPAEGAGRGLLSAVMNRAAAVITDDHPGFWHPRLVRAATRRCRVRFEAVDSNGLYPFRAADRAFPTAHSFRRHLQKVLADHLEQGPVLEPLAEPMPPRLGALPEELTTRWPAGVPTDLGALPIDHEVTPVAGVEGGFEAAHRQLRAFVSDKLDRYDQNRNDPVAGGTSGLSPHLHFGHVGAHEVFAAVAQHEGWSPADLSTRTDGSRSGWWGMSAAAEAFLDQLVTWRELGFNMCAQRDDYDRYESLPDWARTTLEEHAADAREHVYSCQEFEAAATHDPIWNAAQTELLRTGIIHNYLRMLWGKKILEWSVTPQEALEVMIQLNNKYALDGRDPNSYSGIFWCLGRYDRAWGPERPVVGKVRYMSSENTRRKLRLDRYLEQFTPAS